jgi:hypothetical protein
MASKSENARVKENGRVGKARARGANGPAENANGKSPHKSNGAVKSQPAGTDVVPVMKLRAIDILDEERPASQSRGKSKGAGDKEHSVIPMSSPVSSEMKNEAAEMATDASGSPESMVTDPELLELLEQLSATIDTATTVLDAASEIPGFESELRSDMQEHAMGGIYQGTNPKPQSEPEPEDEGLPPIAARFAQQGTAEETGKRNRFGFGLIANMGITGLIFAAGGAWLIHTNPWLTQGTPETKAAAPEIRAISPSEKDQSSLAMKVAEPNPERMAPQNSQSLAALTPPDMEPAPMEVIKPAPKTTAVQPKQAGRGVAGQPIALNLQPEETTVGPDTSVMVQGVPANAEISGGKDLGSGNWLLSASDLKTAQLTTTKDFKPGAYELEVIMVRSDGSVPISRKIEVTVEAETIAPPPPSPVATAPASTDAVKSGVGVTVAAPQPAPAAKPEPVAGPPLTAKETKALLSRGNALLDQGDVAGARLLLEYAAQRGSKEAMVMLAKSYDPDYLAKLGVLGVRADAEKASHWYDRAENTASSR